MTVRLEISTATEQRLAGLRATRDELLADRDDPHTLSHVTVVEIAIAAAERERQNKPLGPHRRPHPARRR